MQTDQAEVLLRDYSQRSYVKKLEKINERVYCAVGYGHSNCIYIQGETSWIVVDTMESGLRAQRLYDEMRKIADKPVKTLIYTHSHPDHLGGAGAYKECAEKIIMSAPRKPMMKHMNLLQGILGKRCQRQLGDRLTDEELITQGLGIREGKATNDGDYDILPPNEIWKEAIEERIIDGVKMQFISAPGETDDAMYIWLPEDKVLCCGDNYYACWPNLYAIRGSQYRDIATWIDSLRLILTYPVEYLLPGHTNVVKGNQNIVDVITTYSDAIESVLLQTLECMAQGLSMEETVTRVALPQEYAQKDYLGEFYGTVAWSVRAVYTGYVGWFDGNPLCLNPLAPKVKSEKTIALMGGADKVFAAAKEAYEAGEYQWSAELCELLENVTEDTAEVKDLKSKCFVELGKRETSANGRHYYLVCAKELLDK